MMGTTGIEGYILAGRRLDGSPPGCGPSQQGLPSTRAMTKRYPSIPFIPIIGLIPGTIELLGSVSLGSTRRRPEVHGGIFERK